MQKIHNLKELVVTNKACYDEYLLLKEANHFNVIHQSEICEHTRPMHRNDFYKISLIEGIGVLQINDEYLQINGSVLIFYNPTMPYYWHSLTEVKPSYSCFFDSHFQSKLLNVNYFKESSLFKPYANPVCVLDENQAMQIRTIFETMCAELQSDYHHKYDTLATYLELVIQKGYQYFNATKRTSANSSAATRIVSNFLNLLERQFPIDVAENKVLLKTPKDFAAELSVHVNHLNHSVKELLGSRTSELIAARLIAEAKALLKHSHADVAEIAYMLGFEYPSNFNTFFKKHTKGTPNAFRNNKQSNF